MMDILQPLRNPHCVDNFPSSRRFCCGAGFWHRSISPAFGKFTKQINECDYIGWQCATLNPPQSMFCCDIVANDDYIVGGSLDLPAAVTAAGVSGGVNGEGIAVCNAHIARI